MSRPKYLLELVVTRISPGFLSRLRGISDLPTMSLSYGDLMDAVKSEETSVDDIVRVIERDPAVASKVLKVANSAFYSISSGIDSIKKAVNLIGFKEIANISMTVSVIDKFKFGENIDLKKFWNHSILVASIAKNFSIENKKSDPDTVYTIGLLHDVGLLIIAHYFPEEFDQILGRMAKYNSIFDSEMEVLGFTHFDVTVEIMKKWNFSGTLYQPVEKLCKGLGNNEVVDDVTRTLYQAHKFSELIAGLKENTYEWDIIPELAGDKKEFLYLDYNLIQNKVESLLSMCIR